MSIRPSPEQDPVLKEVNAIQKNVLQDTLGNPLPRELVGVTADYVKITREILDKVAQNFANEGQYPLSRDNKYYFIPASNNECELAVVPTDLSEAELRGEAKFDTSRFHTGRRIPLEKVTRLAIEQFLKEDQSNPPDARVS